MEFALLGPLEVRIDGRVLPLGGPKQRALLALLLLHANEAVSRDRLVDDLWGARAPASAQRSLDTYVYRLRMLLGSGRIERRPPGYLIRVEPGEFDLERFERLLKQGRAAAAAGDAAAARTRLREALALWRGRALADLENEPFAASEAGRLEERRLLAVEARVEAELELGGGAELVDELERLAVEHPFRERLVEQLMRSLYRAGRKSDALAAYQQFRARCADELGLEPSGELRELERRILVQDDELGPPKPPLMDVRTRRGRAWFVAVAIALAAVAASVAVGILLGIGGSKASTARGSTTRVFELTGTSSLAGASLADAPTAMVADTSSIWLAEPSAGAVMRVDLASRRVEETVPLEGSPSALAVGGGSVWAATVPGETVDRIDQATERITDHIPLPRDARVEALAYGFGRLWVADPHDQELLAYDPATDRPARTFGLDVQPSALAAGAGAVWVADYEHARVEEVDPRSGADLGTIQVGDGPAAIAVGDGAVWVANSLDNTVSRIDPGTGTAGPAISVGNDPIALAVSGDSVSVASEYASSVSRIDPRRNAVVQTTAIAGGPTALAAAGGRIWVGTDALGAHRGGTLRLLFQRPFSSLDPALQEDLPPLQSDGLTNDALLTFAWVGTTQQLVPDLAYTLPTPANGDTTYTFRLRPVRYADGRLVQPEDFRRAIERLFRVHAGWSGLFTDIVDADKCTVHHCDLSRGILVDDSHRTITFRLTSPDPFFRRKMTLIGTAPVPPGTPFHDLGFTPMPGTGPYIVASADKHKIRYVRNPRFAEWSHAAQPDGNPDVIVMRFGLPPAREVREVELDKADWSADGVPGNLLPEVMRRFPGQWHRLVTAETDWLQLNTTSPPFDDVRVRKALNLAIDRAAIVRMYGGRLTATPTCQLLPPGLSGYRPYCPYTRQSGDGRWRAPDLARARALVGASGTRGEQVTAYGQIGGGPVCTTVIRYTVRVLRELGYRAQAHIVPQTSYFETHWNAVQMACIGEEDFQPADFFGTFRCSSLGDNGWFCDPRLDADVQRARTLEETDPRAANALLTKLDREATDRAIALPLVNQHFYDFVSASVKNYVEDPKYGLVVDQAPLR
jgi:DNA-binding SARP family transcriptional activator/ABC-type transport system substrate-binding protein